MKCYIVGQFSEVVSNVWFQSHLRFILRSKVIILQHRVVQQQNRGGSGSSVHRELDPAEPEGHLFKSSLGHVLKVHWSLERCPFVLVCVFQGSVSHEGLKSIL